MHIIVLVPADRLVVSRIGVHVRVRPSRGECYILKHIREGTNLDGGYWVKRNYDIRLKFGVWVVVRVGEAMGDVRLVNKDRRLTLLPVE